MPNGKNYWQMSNTEPRENTGKDFNNRRWTRINADESVKIGVHRRSKSFD